MVVSVNRGPNTNLAEADLATYGIIVSYDLVNPMLTVETSDVTLPIEASVEIRITSSVIEEPSWADYAVITINYSNPSISAQSTVETFDPIEHEASVPYSLTMQSRNRSGKAIDRSDDVYSITMTRTDGGGDQIYYATATHDVGGLYSASVTPHIAGVYAVSITMTNAY